MRADGSAGTEGGLHVCVLRSHVSASGAPPPSPPNSTSCLRIASYVIACAVRDVAGALATAAHREPDHSYVLAFESLITGFFRFASFAIAVTSLPVAGPPVEPGSGHGAPSNVYVCVSPVLPPNSTT